MQLLVSLAGLFFLWVGVAFSVLGVLGLIRLPDVYCRLHASGKVSTMGLFGLLFGASVLVPNLAPKAIALAIFMIISSPVSTHAIAMAAYRMGVPMQNSTRDDLGGHFRESRPEDI